MSAVVVRIRNWRKYNPRKDIGVPTWFAISNRIAEDQDLDELNGEQFKAFIYILGLASQRNTDTIVVNLDRAERVARIKPHDVLKCIEICRKYLIFDSSDDATGLENDTGVHGGVHGGVQSSPTTYIQTNIQTITPTPSFDFETPYREYPRKEGKSAGMKRLKTLIKDPDTFAAFCRAVTNYAQKCKAENAEVRFIKHWSSFVGTKGSEPWRDYVDLPSPSENPLKPINGILTGPK